MDATILKQVVSQIHRRYPEFAGIQPKVRTQTPPQSKAESNSPNYLLTFSGKATAKSADSIIEAVEYASPSGKPFLLGIQWHPERFVDYSDPFSGRIIERFISELK